MRLFRMQDVLSRDSGMTRHFFQFRDFQQQVPLTRSTFVRRYAGSASKTIRSTDRRSGHRTPAPSKRGYATVERTDVAAPACPDSAGREDTQISGSLLRTDGSLAMDPILLRDACTCAECIDPSTRQREFSYAEIPSNIEIQAAELNINKVWKVTWNNDVPGYDNHVSYYSKSAIQSLTRLPISNFYHSSLMLWNKKIFEAETEYINYHNFMQDRTALATAVRLLRRHGLLFITETPEDERSVGNIAERFAPLRNTFYGPTWDVRSVPKAKNVAYTSKYLGFHMDLLYMRESPGFQLLHCLQNTCTGGESRFVDTFKGLDCLITHDEVMYESLRRQPVRYEYANDGHFYTDFKFTVETKRSRGLSRELLNTDNAALMDDVSGVNWSPPFVGGLHPGSHEEMQKFVEASKSFADVLERDDLVYQTKMDAGTCVIFDNLRVAHARNAFDMNSGHRWLRGAYFDSQGLLSKEIGLWEDLKALDLEHVSISESLSDAPSELPKSTLARQ